MVKDLDVRQLLILMVLVFIDTTKSDNLSVLWVLLDQMRPLITNKKDVNAVLVAASKISKVFLYSKFTVNVVDEFQLGYQNARNK